MSDKLIVVVVAIFMVFCWFLVSQNLDSPVTESTASQSTASQSTEVVHLTPEQVAEQKAAELLGQRILKQFSAWDGSHPRLTELIKESMKNPASYSHVRTTYRAVSVGDAEAHLIVETTFRGTNSFGAVVPNTVIATVTLDGDVLEYHLED